MQKITQLFDELIQKNELIDAIWSNPRHKQFPYQKITIKPILLKNIPMLQCIKMQGQKALHTNLLPKDLDDFIKSDCILFKQLQIYSQANDYSILINKKGESHIQSKPSTKESAATLSHNRQKNYLLDPVTSQDFLIRLGLADKNGQIKPSKYDKYKQINKYIEFVDAVADELPEGPLHIVDFGCGKSYLTFAMYHYLHELKHLNVTIMGLDLKEDVIAFCNDLAQQLGYTRLHFEVGDIGHYMTKTPVDMVVSLHACNTATDAALLQAINWQAKVILAVPCCHHECYTQITNPFLAPFLKHGILKERMAALITDGMRAQMLEAHGYKVNVMEFIDMTHTPKNILIRAIKIQNDFNQDAYTTYKALSDALHLNLSINTVTK